MYFIGLCIKKNQDYKSNILFQFLLICAVFLLGFNPHIAKARTLNCSHIQKIQSQFLNNHVIYSSLSPQLQQRVINQLIKGLDPEKFYFLKSDVQSIKKKSYKLFTNITNNNCKDLYYIYNIYKKRVNARSEFANKYLNNNFQFNKSLKYILDRDHKRYTTSNSKANQKMAIYLQYQVANIFMIEKDLKKAITQMSYILKNRNKQIKSWKPVLNYKEAKLCKEKSKNSFKSCKPSKWYTNYLNAFAESLDAHSGYWDNEATEDFQISMNLSLEGIGATLSSRFGYTVVERLVPGGAAFKSKKIKHKDKILAVGKTTKNMTSIFGERIEDVVSIIRGKKGTPVYLKILRETEDKKNKTQQKIFTVKIIRDKVDLKEDAASLVFINKTINKKTYKVAVIKVPSFYGSGGYGTSVTRDVRNLINKAKKKKAISMVLDLSNNRGGSLDESVNLAGLFFSKGNVVKQSEKPKPLFGVLDKKNPTYNAKDMVFSTLKDKDPTIEWSGPLVILVNRLSASASEIVSGVLQNYKRAVIVGGDHTFGKGSVQSVVSAGSKLGAVKTTVGLYFIPSGKSTQKEGVLSDVPMPSIFNIEDLGEKNLDYALNTVVIPNFLSPNEAIFSTINKENWKPIDYKTIQRLKSSSQKRITKSKEFAKIIKQFKKLQAKIKNKKITTISEVLNKKNNKDSELENQDDEDALDPKIKLKRYLKRADVQEAAHIAADLSSVYKLAFIKN